MKKRVSIILGSYNRIAFLRTAIDSIRGNGIRNFYEIIVVDGGSEDGSLEWLLTQKDVITICQHNHGQFMGKPVEQRSWGYFMNLGFKVAQGRYVVMISDDCLLLTDAVNRGVELLERLEDEGRAVGGAAFYFRNWPMEKKYFVQKTLSGKLAINHGVFLVEALEDVGWAEEDEYRFYKADSDLCLKMWRAGYEIVDCPGAYVEHFYDPQESIRQDNNACLTLDREAFWRRWEGVYYYPGCDSKMGRVSVDYEDPDGLADKYWGHLLSKDTLPAR